MRSSLAIVVAILLLCALSGCGGGGGSLTGLEAGSSTASTAALNGSYAFLLTGFDGSFNPIAMAGSFEASGNGRIISGTVDITDYDSGTPQLTQDIGVTGTYTSDVNYRGEIELANVGGAVELDFFFTLQANGNSGAIISANIGYASGTLLKQTTSAFSVPSGSFVYEADSHVPTQRSSIGVFTLASGTITTGAADASIAAASGPVSSSPTTPIGTFSAPSSSTGRGFATLSLPGGFGTNYIYYIVSASQFIAIETDTATDSTMGAIVANAQASPPAAASILPASVFSVTGLETTGFTISSIGTLSVTGGGASGNLLWDTNDAGTIIGGAVGPETSTGTVAYNPANGRGTITITGGSSAGLFSSAVFYLSGPGTGVILDTSASNNRALAGPLLPQSSPGSFGSASLSASMIGAGTSGDSINDAAGEDLLLAATSGSGNSGGEIPGQFDLVSPSEGVVSGETFELELTSSINATSGRATMTAGTGSSYVFYLIGSNQLVFISVQPGVASHYYAMTPQ